MEGYKKLSIATVSNGAVEELFQRDLAEVMKNMDDPSTDPKEPRKIQIELILTQNELREMGVLEVKSKTKLAGARATGSTFVLRNEAGKVIAYENDFRQPEFDFDENNNVSSIDGKSRAAGERDEP